MGGGRAGRGCFEKAKRLFFRCPLVGGEPGGLVVKEGVPIYPPQPGVQTSNHQARPPVKHGFAVARSAQTSPVSAWRAS